ncbi:hypothetical protein EZV62_008675 [Acer yangbiense]|uniref:Uncharacterized protein n=1 Tax=Acer yangbiense TaxID=1000413 RepID=A0A5C7IDK0_9ROSI|nr:hypothetical protein EZV62_008675 [Acer yangbiense]
MASCRSSDSSYSDPMHQSPSNSVCNRHDAMSKMKAERKQLVHGMETILKVVTSIPLIDNHDANSLNQAISIQAIAKASKEYMPENADLSSEKAEMVVRFFRYPKLYPGPNSQDQLID